jgi:DNA-binding transcriptional ArsR family regulator
MVSIGTLFARRKTIAEHERKLLGNVEFSETEKAILEFIASRKATRITDILGEHHFYNQSLSTVKRAIIKFRENNLLKTVPSKDGRDRAMSLNSEKENENEQN